MENIALQGPTVIENQRTKKSAKYTYHECMKNHAAVINGNARDECAEFMAHGEEGTPEALTCAACKCHRGFHRKQIEAGVFDEMEVPEKMVGYPTNMQIMGQSLTDGVRTKTSRTKFTIEHKEKMCGFALKLGLKLQKMEHSAIQQLCNSTVMFSSVSFS